MKQLIIDSFNNAVNKYYVFRKTKGKEHAEALENAYDWFISDLEESEIDVSKFNKEDYLLDFEKRVLITEVEENNILTRKDFVKWFKKEDWEGKFKRWERYKALKREELPKEVIEAIDTKTDDILGLIGDPRRALENGDYFDIRGLVVGYVQSGKTGNYTGLINKAIDLGYRYVIVLAGMHDNLRSQTQERIDEGVIGRITRDSVQSNIGIGTKKGWVPDTKPMTSFDSDFGKGRLTFDLLNDDVRVWVIKKNKSILENVNQFLQNLIESNTGTPFINQDERGIERLHKIPLLVIDDEADQASINTKIIPEDEDGNPLEEYNPTSINEGIRLLLNKFSSKTYIGYTATPFANIFIRNNVTENRLGDDLFPRDFIVMMNQPSNYVGALQVFGGLHRDDKGLPITRDIFKYRDENLEIYHDWQSKDSLKGRNSIEKLYNERISDIIHWNNLMPDSGSFAKIIIKEGQPLLVGEGFMPGKHKKTHSPKDVLTKQGVDLPISLKHAIASFIIGCSIRVLRGHEKKHMSMLIHITKYTAVQKILAEVISSYCKKLFKHIKNKDPKTIDWLKNIYNDDFLISANFMQSNPVINDEYYHGAKYKLSKIDHSWDDVFKSMNAALKKLTGEANKPNVRQISGGSKDLLDYYKYEKEGLSVIAVGGDKLSRGLTLEGLMVSYYLRLSSAYDTLMQMGRWFGYRDGFVDTCRIYANHELLRNYSHIAVAFEELKGLFEEMVAEEPHKSPDEFGLRVQSHPSMIITNAMKMRSGTPITLNFSGKMSETVVFWNRADKIEKNINSVENLISGIGPSDTSLEKGRPGVFIWKNVSSIKILDFLKNYENHPTSSKMQTEAISEYIVNANNLTYSELTKWTVVLFGKQSGSREELVKIGGKDVYPSGRGATNDLVGVDKISTGVITGNTEQQYDFTETEISNLNKEWVTYKTSRESENKTYLSFNRWLRLEKRDKENGLLIIYPIRFNNDKNKNIRYSTAKGDYLIGFATVTPSTSSGITANYVMNEIAEAEYFDN